MSDFLKVLLALFIVLVPSFIHPEFILLFIFIGISIMLFSARKDKIFIVEGNCEQLFNKIQQALSAEKIKIAVINKDNYLIKLNTPFSWYTFGETIHIRLRALQDEKIEVTIMSELALGLYDYCHTNHKNIVKIEEAIGLYPVHPTHLIA